MAELNIPVYVISLARAKERRENMRRRLDALGVNYEVVDAVDGKTLDLSQYSHRLRQNEYRIKYGREYTRGEIGCYFSHHNLWERIAEGENEHALVLEDDAVLDGDFAEVADAVAQCEWHWDVVLFAPDKRRKINRELCGLPGGRKLVRYKWRPWWATAYLITREGAAKLRDYCANMNMTVDIMWTECWKNGAAFYCVDPPPVRQSGEETNIGMTPAKRTIAERALGAVWRQAERLRWQCFLLTNSPRKR